LYGVFAAPNAVSVTLPDNQVPVALPFLQALPSNGITYQSDSASGRYTGVVVQDAGDYNIGYMIAGVTNLRPVDLYSNLTINGTPVPQAAGKNTSSGSGEANVISVQTIVTLQANAVIGITVGTSTSTAMTLDVRLGTLLTVNKIS
jgi:hypothetical protein